MRGVWAAIIMLSSLVVAGVAGVLSWFAGATPPNAVIAAGAAFCGLTSFGFMVFEFLAGDRARG
jgi:hypothetical protein